MKNLDSSFQKTIVKGELGRKLDEYLTRLALFGFSGAMLLAKEGTIILDKGYGLANVAKGIPNSQKYIILLGSFPNISLLLQCPSLG